VAYSHVFHLDNIKHLVFNKTLHFGTFYNLGEQNLNGLCPPDVTALYSVHILLSSCYSRRFALRYGHDLKLSVQATSGEVLGTLTVFLHLFFFHFKAHLERLPQLAPSGSQSARIHWNGPPIWLLDLSSSQDQVPLFFAKGLPQLWRCVLQGCRCCVFPPRVVVRFPSSSWRTHCSLVFRLHRDLPPWRAHRPQRPSVLRPFESQPASAP